MIQKLLLQTAVKLIAKQFKLDKINQVSEVETSLDSSKDSDMN